MPFAAIRGTTSGMKDRAAVAVAFAAFLAGAPAAAAHQGAPARPRAHLSVGPATLTYRGGRATVRWSAPHARHCTLTASQRFWRGRNPLHKCNGRISAVVPAADFPTRWKFTLQARNAAGQAAVVRRTLVVRAPPFDVSPNWSGYVVPSTSRVTAASGRFTVPTLDCRHTERSSMSAWVGTGGAGASSGDLLQTGIRSDCVFGVEDQWYAWWDEFPEYPEVDFTGMSISAGDVMQANVVQNADGTWTTRLDDLTTGVSGVLTTGGAYGTVRDSSPTTWLDEEGSAAGVAYSGGYTAEWIVESFSLYVGLADFGRVTFTGLTTSLPSWGLTGDEQLGLGDAFGFLYAAPSAPDSSKYGFSVSYTG